MTLHASASLRQPKLMTVWAMPLAIGKMLSGPFSAFSTAVERVGVGRAGQCAAQI